MSPRPSPDRRKLLETVMRFAPVSAVLALGLAVSASTLVVAAERAPDPRAATLAAQGRAALAAGDEQGAVDAFEAALALDPAYTPLLVELGRAAQADGLPGKALGYFRRAQAREPRNFDAIAGEGAALVQKGALDRARTTLGKLESLCGKSCAQSQTLAAAIAAGPPKRMAAAEAATTPEAKPTASN